MNDRLDESTSNTREQAESMITAQHEQQRPKAAVETSNNPSRSHQRMRNKASSQFRRVVRNNLEESNSDTANAFSNSLVDTARSAPRPGEGRGPGSPCASSEASFSSSLSSDGGLVRRHASTAQRASSERQERVVTAGGDTTGTNSNAPTAGTATTSNTSAPSSSGDDQTDSRVSAGGSVEREETATRSSRHEDRHHHHHHHHRHSKRHHHRHHHFRNEVRDRDDGSTLRLPSDDGSDRLSTASPAKVVAAAHMPPPRTSSSGDNSSGGEGDAHNAYLLQPHHEPRYQTIRKTFSQLPKRREASKRMETSSSSEELKTSTKRKHRSRNTTAQDRLTRERSPNSSGTEEGYMGSADSKENDEESSSSPSVASSSDNNYMPKKRCRRGEDGGPKDDANVSALDNVKNGPGGVDSSSFSSSEIADFSSGTTLENGEEDAGPLGSSRSTSPSLSSSNEEDLSSEGDYQVAYERAKSRVVEGQRGFLKALVRKSRVVVDSSEPHGAASETLWAFSGVSSVQQDDAKTGVEGELPHIMTIGSDIMAHVLTFLPPPTILDVLTMPLSKEWRRSFTSQPELWRVLCLVEPFKAELITDAKDKNNNECEDDASSDSSSSFCSLGVPIHKTGSALLDKYRLLYTSFVRCMKYLSQIREDAVSGRAPSYIDYGVAGYNAQPPSHRRTGIDRNLQDFLTKANIGMEVGDLSSSESSSSEEPQQVVAGVTSVSKVTEEKKVRGWS